MTWAGAGCGDPILLGPAVHRTTLQPVAVVESPSLALLGVDTPARDNLSITLLQTLKP